MASDHWSGTFAEARDRTGEDETMPESSQSGNYDHVRCRVCGRPWHSVVLGGKVMEGPHPEGETCSMYRPTVIVPPWVAGALARHELAATASNLPASIDDAEVARREVAGEVPTREWVAEAIARHERARDAIAAVANGKPTPEETPHVR